jgi:hypothetical protein
LSHVAGNIAGKYFQQYAILMARLNIPLGLAAITNRFIIRLQNKRLRIGRQCF